MTTQTERERIADAIDPRNGAMRLAQDKDGRVVLEVRLIAASDLLRTTPSREWQEIAERDPPRDRFIFLWCPEDESRWLAKWQGGEWYGVDEHGLTRMNGYSKGSGRVTGWEITHWRPLPTPPIAGRVA